MTSSNHFAPVYTVAGTMWSLEDLLGRFDEPALHSDGVHRISDLHLQPGREAHYRLYGKLVPLPQASELVEEIVLALLKPVLRQPSTSWKGESI